MSDERRNREPRQVVAALDIAQKFRSAVADAMEQSRETGWDSEVLLYEAVRTFGLMARLAEAPPSKMEELIEFFRRVYAGLSSTGVPSVEEVLHRLCPESNPQAVSDDTQPETNVLQ